MTSNNTFSKPVHTIILDSGPIIRGDPSVSTLLQQCEELVTIPAVIDEIKDEVTRSRLQTTLVPFLRLQSPKPESIKFVTEFARKTGDLSVLSKTDIHLIALTYDMECKLNMGDWRLRNNPGQKRMNGPPSITSVSEKVVSENEVPQNEHHTSILSSEKDSLVTSGVIEDDLEEVIVEPAEDSDQDDEGWITPSNIKKKQADEESLTGLNQDEIKRIQVAIITTDYAMQNTILQINLNLISTALRRIKQIKSFILRCHACFNQVRDLSKEFCPRCGKPTLTRVTCSTSSNGAFRIHLKQNMQWNNRGNRYSVPKPVHGSANTRVKGGGKGGWGNDLILAEDQKEYIRAVSTEKRSKNKDIMDPDFLPSFLTGNQRKTFEKPNIGAGRTVNSRRR